MFFRGSDYVHGADNSGLWTMSALSHGKFARC